MRIGSRQIGQGHRPYVIVEIGVNHDGDANRACELVDEAAQAGADAIKLQFFRADLLLSKAASLASYQRDAGEAGPMEMLTRLELSVDELEAVAEHAHNLGLHAIVTVFSLELVSAAQAMPWDAFKTASPDVVNKPLLEDLVACNRPMIVSTGTADRSEVETAIEWLARCHDRLALMQCVSSYPTPEEWASTEAIGDLMELSRLPVGYSDHTPSVETGARAVRHGASLLEKHLTYSQDAAGPDHAASLEPPMLRMYIELANEAFERRGSEPVPVERKQLLDIERDVREASRQSLVATRSLRVGHVIRREDLTVKRPGAGIPAKDLDRVVGLTLNEDVGEDELLPKSLLEAPMASAV